MILNPEKCLSIQENKSAFNSLSGCPEKRERKTDLKEK